MFLLDSIDLLGVSTYVLNNCLEILLLSEAHFHFLISVMELASEGIKQILG